VNSATKKRLSRIADTIGTAPIPREVVLAAFHRFRETGELPDDQPLAQKVIDRARAGFDVVYTSDGRVEWGATMEAARNAPKRADDLVLDALYLEAVDGTGLVRWAARHVLSTFAALGHDVTQPVFHDSLIEVPKYGGVGMHCLGFPERLARPPYEEQARRLLTRLGRLRERVPQGDRRWFDAFDMATEDFAMFGTVPDDELTRDAVLVDAELHALMRHFIGEDVGDLVLALGAAAQAEGIEQQAAIAKVQAVVRAQGRRLHESA